MEEIHLQNGDDTAEDWVGGFKIALEELIWGNDTKLIFLLQMPQLMEKFLIQRELAIIF